jgi:hypothetical protein
MLDDPFLLPEQSLLPGKIGQSSCNTFYISMFKTNIVSVDKKLKVLLAKNSMIFL